MRSIFLLCALLIPLGAAEKPKLGWKSAPAHRKGLTQFVKHPSYKLAPLPSEASVEAGMGAVYSQGQLGSCTAQAGAAAFDYAYKAIHGAFSSPSRLDLYQQELILDGPAKTYAGLRDNGSYTSSILLVLKNSGVCQESKWAYNPSKLNVQPPTCAVKQRSAYMSVRGYDVDTTDGRSVKEAIANAKRPVIFGAIVFNGIFGVKASNPVIPMPSGQVAGGHEMTAIAFSDARQAYLIQNSWGTSWGLNGKAWMPYAYFHARKPDGSPKWVEDAAVIELVK